jgi:hypothetical protein
MIYRNVLAAVVRVLAADTMNDIKSQSWQTQVTPGEVTRRGNGLSKAEMKIYDCWLHARLHSSLSEEQWGALVGKFSTHLTQKIAALQLLTPIINSPAPSLFRERCVVTWGFPLVKGAAHGKRSTAVLPAAWYDMSNWDDEVRSERTRQRWAAGIRRDLEARVNLALLRAQDVFESEGLLSEEVA